MNVKKWIWASLAVFVVMEILNMAIHGGILAKTYEATAALWRSAERMLEELALAQAQRVSELLAGFEALRAAQDAYWQAAQRTHRELVALAQAPCSSTAPESTHGTH